MKYVILVFTFLLFLNCKKESDKTLALNSASKSDSRLTKEIAISVDTIFFSYEEKNKLKDFALVHSIEKKYYKDSISNAKFVVDFIKNNKKVYSYPFQINGLDKGAEWGGYYELDSIASPLRTITVGFPACGYVQNNFLFYIQEGHSNFVHQWDSMADGEWGSWGEIISGTPDDFFYRYISVGGGDNITDESEDVYITEFSDSIHFRKINDKWVKKYKTSKGKIFRSKKQTFEEFNKGE